MDPETTHYLSQWQIIMPATAREPIVDPPVDSELNDDKIIQLKRLKNKELNDEFKFTLTREYLKAPVIS